jgi:peptide/nickel transport system substrate-binding protein
VISILAKSWERVGDNAIEFTLRDDVKWHDGKPFSADDVIFTVNTIQKTQATIWNAYLASVESIAAKDPQTVVVTYKKVYGPDIASFIFGILPKHLFEGQDLAKASANVNPVGTGPYKLLRWSPGRNMVVAANTKYWNGRPKIDQIELRFDIPDKEHLAALRDHRLDFAEIREPSEWNGVLQTPEFLEQFETGTTDETTMTIIAWNNQRKPLDDRRVRIGLEQALDRPRVIEEVLGGAGRAISGPFYPTMWGADPNIVPWPFDKAAAGKLLDEAGFAKKGGKRMALELLVEDSRRGTIYDGSLAIFRADLSDIGVELKVVYLPRSELIDHLDGGRQAPRGRPGHAGSRQAQGDLLCAAQDPPHGRAVHLPLCAQAILRMEPPRPRRVAARRQRPAPLPGRFALVGRSRKELTRTFGSEIGCTMVHPMVHPSPPRSPTVSQGFP